MTCWPSLQCRRWMNICPTLWPRIIQRSQMYGMWPGHWTCARVSFTGCFCLFVYNSIGPTICVMWTDDKAAEIVRVLWFSSWNIRTVIVFDTICDSQNSYHTVAQLFRVLETILRVFRVVYSQNRRSLTVPDRWSSVQAVCVSSFTYHELDT